MSEDSIEKTFQVSTPARVIISNIRGSIIVHPGSAGVVQVKAEKHGGFDNGRYAIEMEQDADGTVHIETQGNEAMFGFLSHPPKVDYTLQVPQDVHLDASGVSSSVNVSGLKGVFKLKTVSGDIELADLSGALKLNTVSGGTSGERLSGPLELDSVSGRVKMQESNFPNADASTVSGDMFLQTALSDGPYSFGSVSGDVRMLVPADTRCSAELKSVSGSIRSSLPATATSLRHGLKVTQIQGGGTAIRLKSVSGSLSIETEGVPATPVNVSTPAPVSASAPTSPPPPPAPLSTAEILQRIERGEMSVDEAIKRMKNQP
jgi:hypothetical protein